MVAVPVIIAVPAKEPAPYGTTLPVVPISPPAAPPAKAPFPTPSAVAQIISEPSKPDDFAELYATVPPIAPPITTPVTTPIIKAVNISSPVGSEKFIGLLAQYAYTLYLGNPAPLSKPPVYMLGSEPIHRPISES